METILSSADIGFKVPSLFEIAVWYIRVAAIVILVAVALRYMYDYVSVRYIWTKDIVKFLIAFLLGAGVLAGIMLVGYDNVEDLIVGLGFLLVLVVIPLLASVLLYKGLKQHKIIYIITLVVLMGLPFLLIQYKDDLVAFKRVFIPEVPETVKQQVDQYIIDDVGVDYFEESYVYLPQESKKLQAPGWYSVAYDFMPLQRYGGYTKRIHIYNGQITGDYSLYNCSRDIEACDFQVSESEFKNIQKEYNLENIYAWDPPTFRYYLVTCDTSDMSKVLVLNYKTGEINIEESVCVRVQELL